MKPIQFIVVASVSCIITWMSAEQAQSKPKVQVKAHHKNIAVKGITPRLPMKQCLPETGAFTDATNRIHELNKTVKAYPPSHPPGPLASQIKAVFQHPCFRDIPTGHLYVTQADSATALKSFWENGAYSWFTSILNWHRPDVKVKRYWILPGIRKTLVPGKVSPGLVSFICATGDMNCGIESRGWALRATESMSRFAAVRRAESAVRSKNIAPVDFNDCSPKKGDAPMGFTQWFQCLQDTALKSRALPLGELEIPKDGWLIISGRRGHYGFCDEIRAYHLGTGAVYMAQSCGGLVLRQGGGVNHRATQNTKTLKVRTGRLSLSNLREAAWMFLMTQFVSKPIVQTSTGLAIPDGLVMKKEMTGFGWRGDGFQFSSNQTRLHWTVRTGSAKLGQGLFTWPQNFNHAAESHSLQLLQVAEAAFVEACPPTPLPADMEQPHQRGQVSGIDARPRQLNATHEKLWHALKAYKKPAQCR